MEMMELALVTQRVLPWQGDQFGLPDAKFLEFGII